MASQNVVNIGSDNGLVPSGTKPLSEPTLMYHQQRAISQEIPKISFKSPKDQWVNCPWLNTPNSNHPTDDTYRDNFLDEKYQCLLHIIPWCLIGDIVRLAWTQWPLILVLIITVLHCTIKHFVFKVALFPVSVSSALSPGHVQQGGHWTWWLNAAVCPAYQWGQLSTDDRRDSGTTELISQ